MSSAPFDLQTLATCSQVEHQNCNFLSTSKCIKLQFVCESAHTLWNNRILYQNAISNNEIDSQQSLYYIYDNENDSYISTEKENAENVIKYHEFLPTLDKFGNLHSINSYEYQSNLKYHQYFELHLQYIQEMQEIILYHIPYENICNFNFFIHHFPNLSSSETISNKIETPETLFYHDTHHYRYNYLLKRLTNMDEQKRKKEKLQNEKHLKLINNCFYRTRNSKRKSQKSMELENEETFDVISNDAILDWKYLEKQFNEHFLFEITGNIDLIEICKNIEKECQQTMGDFDHKIYFQIKRNKFDEQYMNNGKNENSFLEKLIERELLLMNENERIDDEIEYDVDQEMQKIMNESGVLLNTCSDIVICEK